MDASMTDAPADDPDLRAEHMQCPHCAADLYRVDHSPLYDDALLYCDHCANRVEVSVFDPTYLAAAAAVSTREDPRPSAVMRAVEDRLNPCACGGRFRHDAPRRCPDCLAVVIAGEPDVDLWPGYCDLGEEEDEPPNEVAARINQFDAEHIRRDAIWRS